MTLAEGLPECIVYLDMLIDRMLKDGHAHPARPTPYWLTGMIQAQVRAYRRGLKCQRTARIWRNKTNG